MTDTTHISTVADEWRALKPGIEKLFAQQWADPELPGMEYRSSARLADWLEAHDFEVTRKAGSIPTAFVARNGRAGGPVIAILAEYDALPGLGNEAVAQRKGTAQIAGHACGHNHIGPANAGAAIIAARALQKLGMAGEVRVIGCPAEEILWGKIALLQAGVFAGIDAILTSHGDYQTGALSRPCQSVVSGEFIFSGEASHGGKALASNALQAAEVAVSLAETECAKNHPGILLRHVLRKSGLMPSITPAETRVWFTTRGYDFEAVQRAYEAVSSACAKASQRSGTRFRQQFIAESHGYLPNDVLGKTLFDAMKSVGPPQWSAEDLAFMQRLSATCSPEAEMTLNRDIRYFDSGQDYYGQDDGEVSWRIPLGRINWAYPEEVPIHHWAWTALSGHRASHPGPLMGAHALALGAVTLLSAPARIAAAKTELAGRVKGKVLSEPRLGAMSTMINDPAAFWDSTWVEAN
ncbi:MAG TPA: amidohydrolase [Aestuariivirga sp.]|nr:amidohydrolase [Aestuariivirga sp.]